jgi:subtilisin family serine protease
MNPMPSRHRTLLALGLLAACAPASAGRPATVTAAPRTGFPSDTTGLHPVLAPADAYHRGWMPLGATDVPAFLKDHPSYDGRGVIIGILDSGIDPAIPGLGLTTTGERKILDLRDFSGEGAVPLNRVTPAGDSVLIAGHGYGGIDRIRALAAGPLYAGTIQELSLGQMPAADLNGNGENSDTLALLVAHAADGWVVFADADGDGSFADDLPVHDYLDRRETFGWHTMGHAPTLTVAINLREEQGQPVLDLCFDSFSHGSHVAGIAAGHDIYGVRGFDGVAPGAFLLGLKISNDAQGAISTTGSILRAMEYAIHFARNRRLSLVLNLSFGVGNEREGAARIDALVDSVLAANPDVVLAVSAGNDGPGLSTLGFPASATRALTVGATYPGVFLGTATDVGDPVAYFSARGGELAKPEIVTPGLAYSTVPRWNTGDEQKGGTSMAAPHASGLVALLVSGLVQSGRHPEARQIRQALMVTARPIARDTYLDEGTGVPDVEAAWRWLEAKRAVPELQASALPAGTPAAYRGSGLVSAGDTIQRFRLTGAVGAAFTLFFLRSNAAWLRAPDTVTLGAGEGEVTLRYDASALREPGAYVGVVSGWTRDTLAGPAFRLVNTVLVPSRGDPIVARLGRVPPGGIRRVFFEADSARPFSVGVTTEEPNEQVLAYLHEPHGQPYREENGVAAGHGEAANGYFVDARDVVAGIYEAVVVAAPLSGAHVTMLVQRSPLAIQAARGPDGVGITLRNFSAEAVHTQPFVALVGEERQVTVVARGSDLRRIPFTVPAWAVHGVIDVVMDREQWPRFTDFGVTVFDSGGHQIAKSPLNYALGRLNFEIRGGQTSQAEVALFPGLADPDATERWTAKVSIRLYADSAQVVRLNGPEASVPAGQSVTVTAPMREPLARPGDGFYPLGIVVVPEGDHTWTREAGLPASSPPPSR